jgi:putative tryptophan/tyrosine transport system substrate-binding protein
MGRRIVWFFVTFSCSFLVMSLAAEAQPARKMYRLGILAGGTASSAAGNWEVFRQGLRQLGWVEGQNIALEYRWAEGQYERFPDLAAELVRLQVDVIVASITPAALAATHATRTIPIVVVGVHDPVGSGLVASLAQPGGNVTGLSGLSPALVGKQLEFLKEVVPTVSRVAVLWNPASPGHALMVQEAEVAAQALVMQLHLLEARSPDEFDSAFAAMTSVGALLILRDAMFNVHRSRLAELAAKSRLPAMYGGRELVEAGGLIGYGAPIPENFRRAATYVDKILKGAKPTDLPVEQPMKFELVINLKTAKALGITMPPSLLLLADEVIQ